MALDLSEIIERLKFVDREIAGFADELSPWLVENVDLEVVSPDVGWVIHGRMKCEIPASFRIRVGRDVHTLRSALDSLACVLATRHSGSEKHTYFPISASKAVFDADGEKKMKLLSDEDKDIIRGLEPFNGGNDTLFALHQLDIIDKHRRLSVHATVIRPHLEGNIIYAYMASPLLTRERQYVGKVVTDRDILHIGRRLVFIEPSTSVNGKGVILSLMAFSREVSRIVGLFN
jgi:hypothetical protein